MMIKLQRMRSGCWVYIEVLWKNKANSGGARLNWWNHLKKKPKRQPPVTISNVNRHHLHDIVVLWKKTLPFVLNPNFWLADHQGISEIGAIHRLRSFSWQRSNDTDRPHSVHRNAYRAHCCRRTGTWRLSWLAVSGASTGRRWRPEAIRSKIELLFDTLRFELKWFVGLIWIGSIWVDWF